MKIKPRAKVMSAFDVFRRNQHGIKKKEKVKERKRTSAEVKEISDYIAVSTPKRQKGRATPQPSTSKAVPVAMVVAKEESIVPYEIPCGNIEAEKCFNWLINPVPKATFFQDTWEKKPLHIKDRGDYYANIFSCKEFDRILRNHHLEFKTNIDIVTYHEGKRVTLTPDGRAYGAIVWDYFQNGSTIRLLNPQTFSKSVWKMCSLLQEYFGNFVGANMYLTPPGSQGFAPHYDDIEAFVLQLEGTKVWKIYPPLSEEHTLPRYSSKDFSHKEIGEPIFELEVKPGDLLYFPRGFIHEAMTSETGHSMHLTLSTYQRNTYGDLLQTILPKVLEAAMEENINYRESLPNNYLNFMGKATSDEGSIEREEFFSKLVRLTQNLKKYLPVDHGADMMAKDFIHSSLPPCLTEEEKRCSIHENGERWQGGKVCNSVELKPDTEIAFIRKRAVRLICEEQELRLYHSFENSRVYKEREAQYVEIDREQGAGIEMLLNIYPRYIPVEQLPLKNLEQQMDLASLLYDKGIIRTRKPLTEDGSSSENE